MINIKGIIPALLSPCDKDGKLNLAQVPQLIDFLLDRNIGGLFVGGSTGEGFSLYTDERKLLTRHVIEVVNGRLPVIAHVGSLNYREVLELAKNAGEIGADAVSSVLPFYYNYSLKEITDYYSAISEASGLPVIIYCLGSTNTLAVDDKEFIDSILSIDNIYGIKFSSPDIFKLNSLKLLSQNKITFHGGCDELPLPLLAMGAQSLIGSNFNAIPEAWNSLYDAFIANDLSLAMKLQERITYYIKQLRIVSPVSRAKTNA